MATKLNSLEEEMALLPKKMACGELPAECQRPLAQDFLALCCRLCVDSVCNLRLDLLKKAQEVWVAQVCKPAMLAAAVVLLQSSNFGAGIPALRRLVESNLTWAESAGAGRLPELKSFPFAPEFLVLYQTFVPMATMPHCGQSSEAFEKFFRVGCSRAAGHWPFHCEEELLLDRAVLLPAKADISKAGCFTSADDDTLALRCRSRRFDSKHLAAYAPRVQAPQWRCPAAEGVENKYTRESFRNCAAGFGSWGRRIESHLKCVAVQVAETLQLRPDESVLDWGSGCGWALTWMSSLYGIRGYGVEATAQNVAWAQRFSEGQYCLYGGFDLGWVPDNSFDAAISYWVLYHHNASLQCQMIQQLVRKLRPGGRAWFGGNIPSPGLVAAEEFTRSDWLHCLQANAPAVLLDFHPDAAFFRGRVREVGAMQGDYLYFHPTYSVIVRRL